MKIKWFTLIELIIVISIIMIVSSSWTYYFSKFIWSQKIKQELEIIKSDFDILDKNIKNYNIFDYKINLNIQTWSLAYTYYTNLFDTDNYQLLDLNSITWTWIIFTNDTSPNLWNFKIYKKNKLFINELLPWNISYSWNFYEENIYKINWNLSWIKINDIWIKYFSASNIENNSNNFLTLIWINTEKDKSWNSYSSITITNIWNKKELLWNWEILLNQAYLFFEREWIEETLLIQK